MNNNNPMLTDAQINEIFNAMPDGPAGFLKSWGYRQFARAVEKAVVPKAAEAERSACADIARGEWRARKNLHDQEGQPQDIRNMHQAGMQSAALINLAIRKRGTGGAG